MLDIIPCLRGPLDEIRDQFIHSLGGPRVDWDALDAEFSSRILHHRATAGEPSNTHTE